MIQKVHLTNGEKHEIKNVQHNESGFLAVELDDSNASVWVTFPPNRIEKITAVDIEQE